VYLARASEQTEGGDGKPFITLHSGLIDMLSYGTVLGALLGRGLVIGLYEWYRWRPTRSC
jgi:hypothetical protein